MTQLIGNIEERRKLRNDIEQTSLVSIRARNLLAEKETLEIERQSATAKLEQERKIEAIRASQKAEIAQTQTKYEAEATAASIASKRAIEEERIHLERDTSRFEVERDQDVELAKIEKQILVLQKEVEASSVRVASEVARRTAAIGRMIAERDADILKISSESEKVHALVAAESKRLLNEAENVLSDDARATRFREKLLDRLEGIVREGVRPLEKIEDIKIVQMGGFGSGNQGEVHRSPTDEVIESALRFRAQAPLIDEMMKEIGVENSGVAKMGDIFRAARDANSLAKEAEPNKKKKDQA